VWKIIYVAAILLSSAYYGWLAWCLSRAPSAGPCLLLALIWAVLAPLAARVLDNPFRALEFFAVQVWLAGLFLAPVCVRRLIRYLGRKIKVES